MSNMGLDLDCVITCNITFNYEHRNMNKEKQTKSIPDAIQRHDGAFFYIANQRANFLYKRQTRSNQMPGNPPREL